jgi:hypothetical protein
MIDETVAVYGHSRWSIVNHAADVAGRLRSTVLSWMPAKNFETAGPQQ